jgi:hypothetical protein
MLRPVRHTAELCATMFVFHQISSRSALMPILLIILILLLLGSLPTWPYSHDWGYYPTGGIGLLLLIVLLTVLMGRRGRTL